MNYGADTSIVLRVLTGQPESLAMSVRTRLETLWLDGAILDVCDLVVSEAYFALQHSYGLSKEDALDALVKLAAHPGFRLSRQAVASLRTPNLAKVSRDFSTQDSHLRGE